MGAHLLPYVWLNRSAVYGYPTGAISFVPLLLAMRLGEGSFSDVNFVVRAALVVGAWLVRRETQGSPRR